MFCLSLTPQCPQSLLIDIRNNQWWTTHRRNRLILRVNSAHQPSVPGAFLFRMPGALNALRSGLRKNRYIITMQVIYIIYMYTFRLLESVFLLSSSSLNPCSFILPRMKTNCSKLLASHI